MEELLDYQIAAERQEESASPWPLQNPTTIEETERQLRLRTRVAEYLEAQRRLELEIAQKAEAERIRKEQKRLEEERKKLEAEVVEEKKKRVGDWDPILISLVRQAIPNLISFDVCSVQPMIGSNFAMKSKYEKEEGKLEPNAKEPLFDGVDEPRNREIISERLREKLSKIINGTENW